MKTHLPGFTLFALLPLLTLIASTASAQIVYENGPINGQENAWTINFGFALGDSFVVSGTNSTIGGFAFGAWLTPGDVLQSAELSITSEVLGGTTYFDQDINFTASGCFLNSDNFQVCTETGQFTPFSLSAGTYWVNLQNAVSAGGNPVFWDQNEGVGCDSPGCPSIGSEGAPGTIPSEAFSVLGTSGGGGTTPEPGSLLLFASGIVASATVLRRKLS